MIISNQLSYANLRDINTSTLKNDVIIAKATKDIAKIIESQFELEYIIPIMGEVMDKYLKDALVYIFQVNDKSIANLSWPLAYAQKSINPILSTVIKDQKEVISFDKQVMAIPIIIDCQIKAIVIADAKVTELKEIEIETLRKLTEQCKITIQKASAYSETVKHATIDALTGLNNRRQCDFRLEQETSIVKRTDRKLSVLLIDIDHFKKINDTHGHSVGDYILKEVARIIDQTCRNYDISGRYGGEEFVIISPNTTLKGGKILAERLTKFISQEIFTISNYIGSQSDTLTVTVSIGVAEYFSTFEKNTQVYENADIALYKAKKNGRNRVEAFLPENVS